MFPHGSTGCRSGVPSDLASLRFQSWRRHGLAALAAAGRPVRSGNPRSTDRTIDGHEMTIVVPGEK